MLFLCYFNSTIFNFCIGSSAALSMLSNIKCFHPVTANRVPCIVVFTRASMHSLVLSTVIQLSTSLILVFNLTKSRCHWNQCANKMSHKICLASWILTIVTYMWSSGLELPGWTNQQRHPHNKKYWSLDLSRHNQRSQPLSNWSSIFIVVMSVGTSCKKFFEKLIRSYHSPSLHLELLPLYWGHIERCRIPLVADMPSNQYWPILDHCQPWSSQFFPCFVSCNWIEADYVDLEILKTLLSPFLPYHSFPKLVNVPQHDQNQTAL